MKILIGTYDIAGWMQHYKTGFESLGYKVTTAVSEKPPLFNYEYDYLLGEIANKGRYIRPLKKNQYLQRVIRKVQNKFADRRYEKLIYNLIDEHDLIITLRHAVQDCQEV